MTQTKALCCVRQLLWQFNSSQLRFALGNFIDSWNDVTLQSLQLSRKNFPFLSCILLLQPSTMLRLILPSSDISSLFPLINHLSPLLKSIRRKISSRSSLIQLLSCDSGTLRRLISRFLGGKKSQNIRDREGGRRLMINCRRHLPFSSLFQFSGFN